ncbi:MAG: MAPEG family protein [Sphingomonadales bacterium]|nr:MAPEG family protein [Sphingomonadales bacterium]MDE2568678.1 MAPEG family protein [Sphingomonadales bacterium]
MQAQMLAPAAVLVLWSLIMLLWTAGTRFPAMAKSGIDLRQAKRGGRGQDLEGVVPDSVQWKSHNYTHLMEQPTIFYPTVIMLAVMGPGALDVAMAWAYVFIRIVHSIWQATVNVVAIRFALFILATSCLAALAVRAVLATLLHDPSVVTG